MDSTLAKEPAAQESFVQDASFNWDESSSEWTAVAGRDPQAPAGEEWERKAPENPESLAASGVVSSEDASADSLHPIQLDRMGEIIGLMRETMQKYQAAMRQMEVRFEVLDHDLALKRDRNPIHHIESRVKSPSSILGKLERRGVEATVEGMEATLTDVAGVRVICSYIHDVYDLLGLLRKQDDLEIAIVKDYIANPKPNGYRSLHAIVRIPVYFMDKKELVPVEVQLRTIAMDFWASLEHSLKYKAVHQVGSIDSYDELKDCSRIIEDVESRMQILARALDAGE